MGHNGSRKFDLVSSRESELSIEDRLSASSDKPSRLLLICFRVVATVNFSPIRKIGTVWPLSGANPNLLNIHLADLRLDNIERNERPLTDTWAGLLHFFPSSLAS